MYTNIRIKNENFNSCVKIINYISQPTLSSRSHFVDEKTFILQHFLEGQSDDSRKGSKDMPYENPFQAFFKLLNSIKLPYRLLIPFKSTQLA